MNKVIIVASIACFIIFIILFFIISKKRRANKENILSKQVEELINLHNSLKIELKRTEDISKNEESIRLFNSWVEEYETFQEDFDKIANLIVELKDANSFTYRKDFKTISNEIEGIIFSLDSQCKVLYEKVKRYTAFELENTRISLTLKSRIRELHHLFKEKLNFLDIYNESFNQEINKAEDYINEFEELQRIGEYPEGRSILKNANRILDKLDYITKLILTFQEYLNQLQDDINIITKVKDEINNIGFDINISGFSTKIENFINEKDSIVSEVILIDYFKAPKKEKLVTIEQQLISLDNQLNEFKELVELRFKLIKDIIYFETQNEKLIDTAEILIEGALSEKEEIEKLYDIKEFKALNRFESELSRYTIFKKDYSKLLEITHLAKEDFENSKNRIHQSNQYLVRLLKNIEDAVNELKSIRSDELNARTNIIDYQLKYIEIDLYLRKYDHRNKISKIIKSLLIELENSLENLNNELNKEPLNINNVRTFEQNINRLIDDLTSKEIENNIKQRLGCELLLQYLSQFNISEENNIILRRLNQKYIENEYSSLLNEGYYMLESISPDYKKIYQAITSKVEVERFKEFLSYTPAEVTIEQNHEIS